MAHGQTSERIRCSTCGKTLKLPASAEGKVGKCPACGAIMRVPGAIPHRRKRRRTPPPVAEQPTGEMDAAGDTAELPSTLPQKPQSPPPQVYRTISVGSQPAAAAGGAFVTSSPRLTYCLLYAAMQFLLPIAVMALGARMGSVMLIMFGFLFVHPWIAHFLARWAGSLLVSAICCPGCGFEIDAVGRWTVGSYTPHTERHFYFASNPIDNSVGGHTDCPQCGATIRTM